MYKNLTCLFLVLYLTYLKRKSIKLSSEVMLCSSSREKQRPLRVASRTVVDFSIRAVVKWFKEAHTERRTKREAFMVSKEVDTLIAQKQHVYNKM